MVILPGPRDTSYSHSPELSRVAAGEIMREIEERGYAAIYPGSTLRPETLAVVDEPDDSADLTLYVWVQQVDLPKYEGEGDSPVTFGGIDLRDRDGDKLAFNSGTIEGDGVPGSDLFVVAAPDDPRAHEAARKFGASVLDSTRKFARKVGPLLGGR
jgi:hypothetical protein